MNNVINFLLILTLVFLVYANSNIGLLLARTIPGKLTLVILIIYLSASHGISSGILMSLITIVLLNNFREGLEDKADVKGVDPNAESFPSGATLPSNETINTPDESEKIPINLIIPTKMNKTDLEDYMRTAAAIATMDAKTEGGGQVVEPPSGASDSVAGVSTSVDVVASPA